MFILIIFILKKANSAHTIGSGDHSFPVEKGDAFVIAIYLLHTSKELWGEDALEFKPERFLEKTVNCYIILCYI